MTDEPTREEVVQSVDPRSEQLNSDDLVATGPITVTVAGVRRGTKEQPIQIDLVERDRPFRPCKTVRRCLIALWSDAPSEWVGKRMTLYSDPEVVYGGVRVGGLRVSHASGIDAPKTLLLTKSRGKRSEVVIQPLITLSDEDRTFIDAAREEIAAADAEMLKHYGSILKGKSKGIQDALRPAYKTRLEELKGA